MQRFQVLQVLVKLDLVEQTFNSRITATLGGSLVVGKIDAKLLETGILPNILIQDVNEISFMVDCHCQALQPRRSPHGTQKLYIFWVSTIPHLELELLELVVLQELSNFLDLLRLSALVEGSKQIRMMKRP